MDQHSILQYHYNLKISSIILFYYKNYINKGFKYDLTNSLKKNNNILLFFS